MQQSLPLEMLAYLGMRGGAKDPFEAITQAQLGEKGAEKLHYDANQKRFMFGDMVDGKFVEDTESPLTDQNIMKRTLLQYKGLMDDIIKDHDSPHEQWVALQMAQQSGKFGDLSQSQLRTLMTTKDEDIRNLGEDSPLANEFKDTNQVIRDIQSIADKTQNIQESIMNIVFGIFGYARGVFQLLSFSSEERKAGRKRLQEETKQFDDSFNMLKGYFKEALTGEVADVSKGKKGRKDIDTFIPDAADFQEDSIVLPHEIDDFVEQVQAGKGKALPAPLLAGSGGKSIIFNIYGDLIDDEKLVNRIESEIASRLG